MHEILAIDKERVITLIGAGGKTTTMYYLAREMASAGRRVLITTTTKIFYTLDDMERFVAANNFTDWLHSLQEHTRSGEYLVSGVGVSNGKILGVEADWIDQLSEREVFDHIFVEGDGSARKSLKAPADHEPVVPASTSLLIPIMGLRVLGQPLNDEFVHRAKFFSEITGLKEGEKITVEDYVRVFLNPEGYDLTKRQENCRVAVIINQADTNWRFNMGEKLAGYFRQAGLELILITSYRYRPIIRGIYR